MYTKHQMCFHCTKGPNKMTLRLRKDETVHTIRATCKAASSKQDHFPVIYYFWPDAWRGPALICVYTHNAITYASLWCEMAQQMCIWNVVLMDVDFHWSTFKYSDQHDQMSSHEICTMIMQRGAQEMVRQDHVESLNGEERLTVVNLIATWTVYESEIVTHHKIPWHYKSGTLWRKHQACTKATHPRVNITRRLSWQKITHTHIHPHVLTSLSGSPKSMCKVAIARIMATNDWIVLLYTTGLYCLLSSFVNPPSWIIL